MKKSSENSDDAVLLRQKAERLLKDKHALKTADHSADADSGVLSDVDTGLLSDVEASRSEADTIKFLYELEVHQIELEMQNEELQLAKEKAETNAEKYTSLYDFAPSGYFTLDKEFRICKLNFNGAKIFGKERSKLMDCNFSLFIAPNNRIAFTNFLVKVSETKTKQSCEVEFKIKEKPTIFVHIEGVFSEKEENFLLTVVDITERKQAEEKLKDSEKRSTTNRHDYSAKPH